MLPHLKCPITMLISPVWGGFQFELVHHSVDNWRAFFLEDHHIVPGSARTMHSTEASLLGPWQALNLSFPERCGQPCLVLVTIDSPYQLNVNWFCRLPSSLCLCDASTPVPHYAWKRYPFLILLHMGTPHCHLSPIVALSSSGSCTSFSWPALG